MAPDTTLPLTRRRLLQALPALALSPWPALAQTGDKTLTVTVPWPAGGPVDVTARFLQPDLAKQSGTTVLVDNVPGAGGVISLQRYASRPAVSRGLLLASNSEMIGSLLTQTTAQLKPEEFRPIALAAQGGFLLVAREGLPVASFDELVAHARARPTSALKFGQFGPGSLFHVAWEDLASRTGISALQVPYKGAPDLMRDLGTGDLDIAFLPLNATTHSTPRTRALAMTAGVRNPYFPNLPTIAESAAGKGYRYEGWFALAATSDTPAPDIERLHQWANSAIASPAFADASKGLGSVVPPARPLAELDAYYQSEITRYRNQLRRLGLVS